MPTPANDLRRDAETTRILGARVVIVEADEILAATANGRVDLLRDAGYPAPVQEVRFWLERTVEDGHEVLQLAADIRAGGFPSARVIANAAMVAAAGPVGVLLARRLAANNLVARRIATAAAGTAAAGIATIPGRILRGLKSQPDGRESGTDDRTTSPAMVSLPATITYDGPPADAARLVGSRRSGPRTVAVRASVPATEVTAVHLREMVLLVLGVVGELVGGTEPLRGRTYVISRRAPAPRPARADAVSLDQVGGLHEVVDQFREIAISFQHPEIMARWGARRPQGILLYGPPGTGKTMLARALANEIGASLREIRTPDILDKWLGGSERNIKQIFQEARRYREATVMLFDEFDSIISYAGFGGDAASQAVNAVAGIFKQEMNGLIEANPNVIVIATTNFPQRVDASLIRSGRFDIKMAIPVPDETARTEILTKKIQELIDRYEVGGFQMFAEDVDVTALAARCHGMTGADIQEVLRRVRLAKAMQEARGGASEPITHDDLAAAIANLNR
jgi:transitional endoplasmic reticulum ATPase